MNTTHLHRAFREHARPFRVEAEDPEDHSDLEMLRPVFERRRIVLLGERSHGDGTSFAVKSRLVRFLHRELAIDTVAFEAGIYDCAAAWRIVRENQDDRRLAVAALRRALPGIWSGCAQVMPLLETIAERAASSKPLEFVGFDCQTGTYARERVLDELCRVLMECHVCTAAEWAELDPASTVLCGAALSDNYPPPPTECDESNRQRLCDWLERGGRGLGSRGSEPGNRLWVRILESLRLHLANVWSPDQVTESRHQHYAQRREIALGRILRSWAEEEYPQRRIVGWAHQGHLLRRVNEVPEWAGWHGSSPAAGETLWLAHPDEVYTVGFTTCSGWFGRVGQARLSRVPQPSENTLEGAMLAAGYEAAFLDFAGLPESAGELRRCTCRLKGFREAVIEPQRHLDGLIFIRDMEPAKGFVEQ